MKTKKNNTKKEQITAQVENQESVANATAVTNPTTSSNKKSNKTIEAVASEKKNKKNKKAKVEEIPATKSKKHKNKVVKEVSEKQKDSIREKVVSERDVKYLYPTDDELLTMYPKRTNCSIKDLKKTWRQEVRNEYRKLERDMNRFIQDQSSKEYKAAKKAFDAYAAKVLKPGMAI